MTFKCVFLTLDHDHDFTIIIDPWILGMNYLFFFAFCLKNVRVISVLSGTKMCTTFFVELGTQQICCFSDK